MAIMHRSLYVFLPQFVQCVQCVATNKACGSKEHWETFKDRSNGIGQLTDFPIRFPLIAIQKHSRTFADSRSKSLLMGARA